MTGWASRISRGWPQYGRSSSHICPTASAGPTMDEQRLPCSRARPAKAVAAAGVAPTGTRLAPA